MTKDNSDESNSSGMSFTQMMLVGFIIVVLVAISFFIQDKNLKTSYMLVVGLLLFTLFNIFMTRKYYIALREAVGKQGPQGPKGPDGPQGEPGMCTFAEKCGVENAEALTMTKISEKSAFRDHFDNDQDYKKCMDDIKNNLDGANINIENPKCKNIEKLVKEIVINAKTTKMHPDDYYEQVLSS